MITELEDEFAEIIKEVVKHRAHLSELLLQVTNTSIDLMVDSLAKWEVARNPSTGTEKESTQ